MGTPSFAQAISDIKTQYLDPRRTHMYVDHSLNTSYPDYAGIPAEQQDGLIINFGSYDVNPVSGNQDQEYHHACESEQRGGRYFRLETYRAALILLLHRAR